MVKGFFCPAARVFESASGLRSPLIARPATFLNQCPSVDPERRASSLGDGLLPFATQLICFLADSGDMDVNTIEPRKVMWAVAEVSWEDQTGTPYRAPATLEDTSRSGACIRIKTPIPVGAKLTVKWSREQFSGVTRYCRSDGRDFVLGIQRNKTTSDSQASTLLNRHTLGQADMAHQRDAAKGHVPAGRPTTGPDHLSSAIGQNALAKREANLKDSQPETVPLPAANLVPAPTDRVPGSAGGSVGRAPETNPPGPSSLRRTKVQKQGSSTHRERKVMHSKRFFPTFWRRRQDGTNTSNNAKPSEVPVNNSDVNTPAGLSEPQSSLLSCEDIYHASGILSPHSKYGIAKVLEMLGSKHIRELQKDIKRASVLMALDAAGTTVDEVLQDATRRQHALNSYESEQRKQFEEFEARMARENAYTQAELERVTAHYADRIKHNQEQVARAKDALQQWQSMKEQENQRISEAVALCGKQPAAELPSAALPALPVQYVAAAGAAT